MPNITTTETLDVDGGAVILTRHHGGNSSTDMHLAIDDGGQTVSVMLSADEVRALAERMLGTTPRPPATRGSTAPDSSDRCGAYHTDDEGDNWRCHLGAGHLGNHAVKFGPSWPQPAPEPRLHCGSIRYWQTDTRGAAADQDLRAVCTLPIGHAADYPTHEGPDQTGDLRAWPVGSSCNARHGILNCTLGAGHTGSHEKGTKRWQNKLQP